MCIRDSHYVFDSCEQFSIPAAAKNQELAKEFLRFLYSDESVSAFAEASGALYATKSAREVAQDKLSTAIYNMYGIYDEANASSLIMSFSAVPADCKINPKDEIFNPITSVMNDEMTVEEWAQNVEDAFAPVSYTHLVRICRGRTELLVFHKLQCRSPRLCKERQILCRKQHLRAAGYCCIQRRWKLLRTSHGSK